MTYENTQQHLWAELDRIDAIFDAAQPIDGPGQIDTPGAKERHPDREADTFLDPDEMAETYWHLVEQDDVSTQPFEVHITNGTRNSESI